MFAIIETGAKQYKVSVGDRIKVEKLADKKEGDRVKFAEVLMISDDKDVKVGQPLVKGASVEAKVLAQGKSPKITILKYRPKKRYQKKQGHRQPFTEVEIVNIKG
jgi:large subunit ribosomal protein L21